MKNNFNQLITNKRLITDTTPRETGGETKVTYYALSFEGGANQTVALQRLIKGFLTSCEVFL